ncbi:MAG: 23S rRNA pseudouridine1911/1915/1917 synthase [Planctomycetota bacterium]|jgi:23S rRNA pseudouridine1911/1915/1917 synthase
MESVPHRNFEIPEELNGSRLDRALSSLVEEFSRDRVREMVEDGRVLLDGNEVRKPSQKVAAGDRVEIDLQPRDRTRRGSEEGTELAVVYEDEHLVIVNKPAGMVAHPSTVVSGGTLSEVAAELFGALPNLQGEDRPGVVHRLDKDTSGVMVMAKTEEAGLELMRQFREREVDKTYLALVDGDPRFDSDWVDVAIGRKPGHGERMSPYPPDTKLEEGCTAKPAETFYQVTERFGDWALLECTPKTGRTHQIRVHLMHIGHSIVKDPLYKSRRAVGRKMPKRAPRLSRHALHAYRLAFVHPATGERVAFVAEPPADMADLIAFLRAESLKA